MIERRLGLMLSTFVAAAAAIATIPAAAGAAVACTFTPATATASVTMNNTSDAASLGRAGAAIQVNGVNCGTATVTNTDLIDVVGSTHGGQRVSVDLTGGPLAPGKTAETGTGAISEIEINADLRSGSSEEIAVVGSSGADTAVFGSAGARLNTDKDIDLTFSGLDQVELDGNDGADTLSVGGGGGSGEPFARFGDIDGGNGSDTLTGGRASDTINGGADDSTATAPGDVLRGGLGGDTLAGGAGNDEVLGNDGGDTVDGNLGDDVINGGPDADTIGFNGGLATLDGADDISGGPDFDTLYLTARTQNVIIKLDDLANDGGDVGADGTAEESDNVEHDVEGVRTGTGNDTIDARFRSARLLTHQFEGNNGNDSLYGGDADDSLYGAVGNDTLDGGDEDDLLDSGAGLDTLKAGDGVDQLYPGADNDTVDAGDGDDYLDGGGTAATGSDSWVGGPGFDRLYLGSRNADLTIDLDNQADDGEVGENDNIRVDIERFDLGVGNDTLNIATAAANAAGADNEVYGGNGNDTIKSGPGEDYLDGGNGNDEFTGGEGEDRAFGFAGTDRFLMKDGFFDHVDGGVGDGVNDTGQFDTFDERLNFP